MSPKQVPRPAFLSVERLGAVAMVAFPLQPFIVFAFAFIQPEVPLSDADSVYALGRLGWLRQLGFVATGIGSLAIALGLSRSLASGKRVRLAVVLLAVGGVAQIGTGLFKTDLPEEVERTGLTFSGLMHILLALLSFVTITVGLFVLWRVFARDPRWHTMARPTRWIAWWSVIEFVATLVGGGIAQRLLSLPGFAYATFLGWRMRQLGARAA
jgi:hypothetical protein